MATLTIRDFPDALRDRLRVQAAEQGRSMEAEARRLLTQSLVRERPHADAGREAVLREVQDWVAARVDRPAPAALTSDKLIRDRRREVILEVIRDGQNPEDFFSGEFARICREAGWTKAHVRKLAERRR